MHLISKVLKPFLPISNYVFRWRQRRFGYAVHYNYLPDEILPIEFPVHLDLIWLSHGMYGTSMFMVPKGSPNSARYSQENKYYQTWVGTYYIHTLRDSNFDDDIAEMTFLAQASVSDQMTWLRGYGVKHPHVSTIVESIKQVATRNIGSFTQKVFYGEMLSEVDDSVINSQPTPFLYELGAAAASDYHKQKLDSDILLPDTQPNKLSHPLKLIGYSAIIKVAPKRYILTYACGTESNKDLINDELLRIVSNVDLLKI